MAAGGVAQLLARQWFRWLFGTRLLSQCADGVFQSRLPELGLEVAHLGSGPDLGGDHGGKEGKPWQELGRSLCRAFLAAASR